MASRISEDLIKARLAPPDTPPMTSDYGSLYDGDLDDEDPVEERGDIPAPLFAGLAAALFLLVGGAAFYLTEGFGLAGPAAPQSFAIDARCGSGWQEGMPNDVQLRCYLTTDVKRLCNPAERKHLVAVLERHDADSAKWEKALWSTGFGVISAVSDRSTEIGVLGTRATEALKNGDQEAYERYKREAEALTKEIAGKPADLLKKARDDLPNTDLEADIGKLISQGLLSGGDFWLAKPLLYRRAVEKVNLDQVKPICS